VSFAGFTGIASGVQTMVARYVGQSQQSLIPVALLLGLILSFIGITLFNILFSNSRILEWD